jgi:hypothetical protein
MGLTSEIEWRPKNVPVREVRKIRSPTTLHRLHFGTGCGRPSRTRDLRSVPELPNVGSPGTVRVFNSSTVHNFRTANLCASTPVHYLSTLSGSRALKVLSDSSEYRLYSHWTICNVCNGSCHKLYYRFHWAEFGPKMRRSATTLAGAKTVTVSVKLCVADRRTLSYFWNFTDYPGGMSTLAPAPQRTVRPV